MNEKFFSLPPEKQQRILNAGFRVFSQNSYKKSPMSEIAAILFGISAFLRTGGAGLGLGLAAMFYFLNIVANLMDETAFLKYITPYGYTDGAQILTDGALCGKYLVSGAVFTLLGIAAAFAWYQRKDIG